MIAKTPAVRGLPTKEHRERQARDRRKAAHHDDEPINQETTEFVLANSVIYLEAGPVGVIARIDHPSRTEYAGPLPDATIDAIAEVSIDG